MTSTRLVMTPSVSKNPCASSTSDPGVRIVTVTGDPFIRISSGSSTTTVSDRSVRTDCSPEAIRWLIRRRDVTLPTLVMLPVGVAPGITDHHLTS
jgi:hypothetical protein